MNGSEDDPVIAQRARIARLVALAKRVGYGAMLVAILAFIIGLIGDFPRWTAVVMVAGLASSCVILPIPIVLGYGLRAAEREENGGAPFH